MDEQQLIHRVIAGDREAGDTFVARYRGLVLGLARGRFGFDAIEGEEILQWTVERLWEDECKALRAWRGKGRFTSYLTVIVTRLCLRRREAKARARDLEAEEGAIPDGMVPGAEQKAERGEQQRLVTEALAELSARDRLLLTLRFADERAPSEMAAMLGAQPGTVRKAIHDALKRVRRRLRLRAPELFGQEAGDDETTTSETKR